MYMPEHISGTGDAMSMTGIEPYSGPTNGSQDQFGVVEAGHDQFFFQIPEEAVSSIFESADYMAMMERFENQYPNEVDTHCETDPIRQIKNVRKQLKQINETLDRIVDDNEKRDRREQFMWAGLAGLAVVTLISLFR